MSSLVVEEASAGHTQYAAQRARILSGIDYIEADERSRELATRLVGSGFLPSKAMVDAEHIAIASVHSIRYLLTWNCKHLANPKIAHGVVRMCERLGFDCPRICTPEDLMRA